MYVAAALLASSAPVAGFYLSAEHRSEWQDLFVVCYIAASGLIASLIAMSGLDGGAAVSVAFAMPSPPN